MMFKKIKNNEGSIGIGAMIVFIALILVAAVASAVIIQTAESLQQNAQQVGDDTQEEIAGKVQIHGAFYGDAGADVHLIFSLAPGSGTIQLKSINYQVFCIEAAGAFSQDAGDFDDFLVTTIDGITPQAAAGLGSAAAGTKYFIQLTLVNCNPFDVNAAWSANTADGAISLNLHVNSGGSTYETLDASGTLEEGSSIL